MAPRLVMMSLFLTLLPSGQSLTNPEKFVKTALAIAKDPSMLRLEAPVVGLMVKSLAERKTSCECLDWKKVYTKYGVKCSNETSYHHAELEPLEPIMKTYRLINSDVGLMEVESITCDHFFKHLPENYCVNKDWGYNDDSWCYVSPGCKKARPAANQKVSIKTCGRGDKKLSDFSPLELYELSRPNRSDLDIGMLGQFAWKHWTSDKWSEVAIELMDEAGPRRDDLKEMVSSNVPVLFHHEDVEKALPFHIVKGRSVYEIHAVKDAFQFLMSGKMGSANEMVCVKGCEQSAVETFTKLREHPW